MEVVAPSDGHDPRTLERAARPGRVRAKAVELLDAAVSRPHTAGATISRGLRQAKHLHSRERRLVADGVRDVLRHRAVLAAATASDDTIAIWIGWLVSQGLPTDIAFEEYPSGQYEILGDLAAAAERHMEGLDRVRQVALVGSFDPALAHALVRSLGDRVFEFVRASNRRADIILRVNSARTDVVKAQRALAADGIVTERCALAGLALRVVGRANVQGSPTLQRGLVEVQDEGSQLLAELVDPRGRVVDYCAGAGGKTLALAAMAPDVEILALDVRSGALQELRKRAARAGVRRLTVGAIEGHAAPAVARSWLGAADRVLVDAPCSGTGTLRRHPEHRLRLQAKELAVLAPLQLQILTSAAGFVAPGGLLIYATCSVLRRENEDIVSAFLGETPGFERVPASALLGTERARAVGDGVSLRLTPHDHGTDGFFGAVLRRA